MKNRVQEAAVIVIGCVLLTVFALGNEVRQEWKMQASGHEGKVRFTIERSKPGNSNSYSRDVPRERFRGLGANVLERGGMVTFEYVHDAGTLVCKGGFTWGRGSGSFRFQPDPRYAAELKKLGYEEPDHDQQLQMVLADISLDFARQVKDAGLHASTRQLMELSNHGITLQYVHDMQQSGYKDLSASDYIEFRNHGVEPRFLQEVATLGYDLRASEVVQLRNHGVNADFLADLKDAGYDLPVRRIVELRNQGVDSGYLRELKRRRLQPGDQDLIRFRNHGVSPEFLKELDDAGYGTLTAEEVCRFRDHGVPVELLREAKALGYQFSPNELTDLHNRGVNAAYLRRIKESGLKNLTAGDIMKLRSHGVD